MAWKRVVERFGEGLAAHTAVDVLGGLDLAEILSDPSVTVVSSVTGTYMLPTWLLALEGEQPSLALIDVGRHGVLRVVTSDTYEGLARGLVMLSPWRPAGLDPEGSEAPQP